MIDKDLYEISLKELTKSLKESCYIQIKSLTFPSFNDFKSIGSPIYGIRESLREDCKHEQSTIVIESDKDGNKSQRTICSTCGKLLPKSEINQDSVI